MMSSLANRGLAVVGNPILRTGPIIVVGTARGGTSLVAGTLSKLGVFMGDQARPPVFEDLRLSAAMETRNFRQAKEIAAEYSGKFCKWGWKRPSSIDFLDDVANTLNPSSYIFIYKDILSIAERNRISMLHDIFSGMENALSGYGRSVRFLRQRKPYALLASYEKAVSCPEEFVATLINFCSLAPTQTQATEAATFISRNPPDYLDATRITKAEGRLDGVQERTVYGWARYLHSEEFAPVEIFLNSTKVGIVLANKPRPDLDKQFGLPFAFFFELSENIDLAFGDQLRARVLHEVNDLDNSPFEISV